MPRWPLLSDFEGPAPGHYPDELKPELRTVGAAAQVSSALDGAAAALTVARTRGVRCMAMYMPLS